MRKRNLFVFVIMVFLFTILVVGTGTASAENNNTKVDLNFYGPASGSTYGFVNVKQNKNGDLRFVVKVRNALPNEVYYPSVYIGNFLATGTSSMIATDGKGNGGTGVIWVSASSVNPGGIIEPGLYDAHLALATGGPGFPPDGGLVAIFPISIP